MLRNECTFALDRLSQGYERHGDHDRAIDRALQRLHSLARLVEKSFVQRLSDGRYDIHELLRQYGEAQLTEAGVGLYTRDAHSTYFLEFLHRCESDLVSADQ